MGSAPNHAPLVTPNLKTIQIHFLLELYGFYYNIQILINRYEF